MARHAVVLEGPHHAFGRLHFAIAPLEPMDAMIGVLDEAPVAAALHLHPLDVELVAATPPLRHEPGVAHRLPDPIAWRVEDALDAYLAIARRGDRCRTRGFR